MSVAGGTVAVRAGGTPALIWQRNLGALTSTDAGIYAARAGAVYSVTPATGRTARLASVTGMPSGARVFQVGKELVADSATGVTAYR